MQMRGARGRCAFGLLFAQSPTRQVFEVSALGRGVVDVSITRAATMAVYLAVLVCGALLGLGVVAIVDASCGWCGGFWGILGNAFLRRVGVARLFAGCRGRGVAGDAGYVSCCTMLS